MKTYQRLKEDNDNYIRQFVVANIKLLDNYDLSDAFFKAIQKKFEKEFGFYLTIDGWRTFGVGNLGWQENTPNNVTYEYIAKKFKEFQGSKGLSPKEEKEKYEFKYLHDSSYIQLLKKDVIKMSTRYSWSNDLDGLFRLLRYILTGKIDENLGPAQEIMKLNDLSSSTQSFSNLAIKGLEPIVMTNLKNGKMQIKNLTAKQYSELERIIKLISTK